MYHIIHSFITEQCLLWKITTVILGRYVTPPLAVLLYEKEFRHDTVTRLCQRTQVDYSCEICVRLTTFGEVIVVYGSKGVRNDFIWYKNIIMKLSM